MVILSYVISFTAYSEKLTLDFLGVTLRLFQTLSTFTKSLNNVNNSQVHLRKFMKLKKIVSYPISKILSIQGKYRHSI